MNINFRRKIYYHEDIFLLCKRCSTRQLGRHNVSRNLESRTHKLSIIFKKQEKRKSTYTKCELGQQYKQGNDFCGSSTKSFDRNKKPKKLRLRRLWQREDLNQSLEKLTLKFLHCRGGSRIFSRGGDEFSKNFRKFCRPFFRSTKL